MTDAANPAEILFNDVAECQDKIVITPAAGQTCIPDSLAVTIGVPNGDVTQTFEIASACDGTDQGLILLDNYGSFQSVGYSCDETDIHNCLIDIIYDLEVCNTGSTDETIYDFTLTVNDTICDLLEGVPPEDTMLPSGSGPDSCLEAAKETFVNICTTEEYCATAVANATNPVTGLPTPCDEEVEIKFNWTQNTVPPTPPPTPPPT